VTALRHSAPAAFQAPNGHSPSNPGRAPDPLCRVWSALNSSELLQTVARVRADGGRSFALGGAGVRALMPEEVQRLERQGNSCPDWSRVRVSKGFDSRTVRQCNFHGDVVLGCFTGEVQVEEGVVLPAGVYHSTLVDCVVGTGALVQNVRLLANYAIGEGAVLFDCGSITCDPQTTFGNGGVLSVGPETGGRDIAVYAEIDVEVAAAVARSQGCPRFLEQYANTVNEYVKRATSARGIIGPGASVRHTPQVRNAYLGPHARIEGATLVRDSTLLSATDDPVCIESGACVSQALLQWGSRVSTMAIVEQAVLTEHARAERHAKVTGSIIGCNSSVAAGEVTASLLGPFVNAHHQALLIAAVWPEGKGNISYGANVGSNHTGKAPDQEFLPGEGLFLGLGVNIKYPADFSRAPYSIVACGVTALPQRVAFPFSLINLPSTHSPAIPPAYNEIIPAWVLTDNLYALRRNEGKYRTRNRARRTPLECRILRPEIVDLMRDAVRRLEAVECPRELYTERDIDGLGKNVLSETHRGAAITGYLFFIKYYALLELTRRVQTILDRGEQHLLATLLSSPADDHDWEHPRRILAEEFGFADVASALRLLPAVATDVARAVERSKAKDDVRGPRIIADYAEVHPPAGRDAVVRGAWEEAAALEREVEALLARLEGRRPEAEEAAHRNGNTKPPAIRIFGGGVEGSSVPTSS
jgi:hypothetical protein